MGAALEYVETFTKLIVRNKPAAMIVTEQAAAGKDSDDAANAEAETIFAPSKFLGCVQARPGEVEPPPSERANFHRAIFGWQPQSMA